MGSLRGWLQSLRAPENDGPSAPNSVAFDFAFALALVGLAFLIRFLLGLLGPQILLFAVCYPAILVASLVAGGRSGFIALTASVLLFWWAFVPPVYSFALDRPVD